MLDAKTFQTGVIRPALQTIGHGGEAAEQLVLGTAIQESGLTYRRQLGGGPARGLFQMEPATHDDIWKNYLAYRNDLKQKVESLLSSAHAHKLTELENNDKYAAAMCRVRYLRAPAALPKAGDIQAMANYWKKFYNTAGGKGKPEEFVANWNKAMGGAKAATWWTYNQTTGQFSDASGKVIATGYSGADHGKNNPAMQSVRNKGPIPQGRWKIGQAHHSAHTGPLSMRLSAEPGTNTFGRADFLIHGDSRAHPGHASEGCIILSHHARQQIANSHVRELLVISGLAPKH